MEKMQYKQKLKKFGLVGQIYFIKLRGSVYFLEYTKNNSINLLRKNTNFETKTPIEFYKIIHQDYLKYTKAIKKTNIKKQEYYKRMAIIKKKNKIERLKEEIKKLKEEIKKQQNDKTYKPEFALVYIKLQVF